MSLENALNKALNVGNLNIEGIENPDTIPNVEDVYLSRSRKMTHDFNVQFGKGGGGKSEVKNQNEKVVDYGNGVKVTLDPHKKYNVCDNPLTATKGTIRYDGHKETYYTCNPKVRPHFDINKTAHKVDNPHPAADGTIRDEDGYIVVAAHKDIKFGTVVKTSLGPGKVYDRGKMGINHYDIFTNRSKS